MDTISWQTIGNISIWYIFCHTRDYRQCCHVWNTAQHCLLGLFQDSDFAGDLEDSNSISVRNSEYLQKSHFRSYKLDVQETNFSRTVQKNLKLSHWMLVWGWMVFPLLIYGIWLLLFFTEIRIRVIKYRETCLHLLHEKKIPGKIDDLNNVDVVSSNANSSRKEALLYVFEDNEAVIKMVNFMYTWKA